VWAALGAVLRYVPYVGPAAAFVAPIVIAIAAMDGWRQPLYVLAFMIVLELFTNLVLETVLYAGAAGVSQVGLLVAVTFWTWLWGSMGLVMAIPLTVCVVVVGKHVRGLEYLATLMADTSALTPGQAFYQRLLVRDMNDAADLIDRHLAAEGAHSLHDMLLLPALAQSGADLLQNRLDADGRQQMVTAIREMAIEAADPSAPARAGEDTMPPPASHAALSVLGYGVGGAADELALDLFSSAVADLPLAIDTLAGSAAADVVAHVRANRPAVVCLADLSPVAAARTRHLVKRLRQTVPDLDVIVGRWGGAGVADEAQRLVEAGAAHVGGSVEETRAWLLERLGQDAAGAVTTARAPAAPSRVPPAPESAAAPGPRPAS
jgi:AI-2E family transporter